MITEPCQGKNNILHMQKQWRRRASRYLPKADQRLYIRYNDLVCARLERKTSKQALYDSNALDICNHALTFPPPHPPSPGTLIFGPAMPHSKPRPGELLVGKTTLVKALLISMAIHCPPPGGWGRGYKCLVHKAQIITRLTTCVCRATLAKPDLDPHITW